jgi:hypothetical protein
VVLRSTRSYDRADDRHGVGSYLFVAAGSVPVVAVGSLLAIVAIALLTWQAWSYAK